MLVNAVEGAAKRADLDPGDVHAVRGLEIDLGSQVDRGISDLVTDLLSPRDDPVELIRPSEHGVGVGDLAALQGIADPRRGDRLSLEDDLFDARGGEAAFLAHPREQGQVAALAASKREMLAQVRLRRAETLAEKATHEVLRLGQGEVPREGDDEEGLDAEGLDRFLFLPEGLDLPGGVVRAQDRERVRIERDRDRGPANRLRAGRDGLEDPAVPQVNTVEIADRDDSPAREIRGSQGIADDAHAREATPRSSPTSKV